MCVLTPQMVLRLPRREVLVSWDPLIAWVLHTQQVLSKCALAPLTGVHLALWMARVSCVSCLLILLFVLHSPASPVFPPPIFPLPTLTLCAHLCVCEGVSVPAIGTCQIRPVSVLPSSELTGAFPQMFPHKPLLMG